MRHGEAGVSITGARIAAESPTLAGFGLIVHDRMDSRKWFSGDKRELYAKG